MIANFSIHSINLELCNGDITKTTGGKIKSKVGTAAIDKVWEAHKRVYESIGHNDWTFAIYELYVKPMNIKY